MTEEIKNNEENTQDQVKKEETETKAVEPENVEKKEEEVKEDPNWKAIREARKKDRQEKEAAEKRAIEKEREAQALKEAMESAFSKMPSQQGYYSNYQDQPEEDIIDQKVRAALEARDLQYKKEQMEREKREAPQRILQTYPDFNQVVSEENCDYIDYHHPEFTAPFKHMPEGYEKWVAMYNLVKKLAPNASQSRQDSKKIDDNLNKPRSMSSTGMSQDKGEVSFNLTKERKQQNWERMKKLMNSAS